MMLREMRKISCTFVLAAILILLAFKILPHHHHALHLPETLSCIATMHIGVEECDNDDGHGHHHDHETECPGSGIFYTTCPDEEHIPTKAAISHELSPFIAEERRTIVPSVAVTITQRYKNPKIPDDKPATAALRAPPTV